MWKDIHPATKREQVYQPAKYKEDKWWIAEDLQREIQRRKGRRISLVVIGRLAKEFKAYKDTGNGYKVYDSKKLLPKLEEYVDEYYRGIGQ